jgi:2-polyprenyl-3-methyl-5-hydroxy-6-metoxy-1,4-benzoquinol methylase
MSAEDEYRCAGCGQPAHQNLPTRFEFDLFYCRQCGLGQASAFTRTDHEDYYYFEDSYDEQYAAQDRAHLSELLKLFFAPEFFRGKRAIDVGPGTGELLQLLLAAGADPLGVEINDLGVSMLVEKDLSVVQGVLGKSASQKTGDADCVFALNVLEHVDDLKARLPICRRW